MKTRRKGREIAIQALYALEMGGSTAEEAVTYLCKEDVPSETVAFARELVMITLDNLSRIDAIIKEQTRNWELNRVAVIDRNILRMAIGEILYVKDIPAKVSIDEAIELAKKYSTEKSGKFVNGILDPIAKQAKEISGEKENKNDQ